MHYGVDLALITHGSPHVRCSRPAHAAKATLQTKPQAACRTATDEAGGEPVQSGSENRPDSVEIEREVSARPSGFATGGSVDNRDDDHSR